MKAFGALTLCAMMLALVLATAVAGATTKTGTKGDDVLRGRRFARHAPGRRVPRPGRRRQALSTAGPEATRLIVGGWGRDRIVGGEGRDHIAAGEVHDRVFGNQGRDRIRARDATRDIVDCGKGADRVLVDPRDELRSCELRVRP
jgi:Ca2+-binding RTX toxin-like protein